MKKSMIFLFLVLLSLGASPSGAAISLQSFNYPDHFVRHRNFQGELTPLFSPQDRADATFRIVPGLATPSKVSFESVNFPGHYLINLRGKVVLRRYENDPKFIAAATFAQHPGMADPTWVSFEAHNAPGAFLRHRGNNLRVEPQGPPPYYQDCTFRIVGGMVPDGPSSPPPGAYAPPPAPRPAPASPEGTIAIRSINYPNCFIRHHQKIFRISEVHTQQEMDDSTFRMVPGLADPYMVSFESVNFPGYYMRHTSDGRVELQSYRESFQFKSDATFRRVPGLVNPGMTSFAAHNRSDMFLRHDKFLLRVEKPHGPEFPADATFQIMPR